MAALSTTSSHRVADTTHVALLDGERDAGIYSGPSTT
jgi:hypothetical protein